MVLMRRLRNLEDLVKYLARNPLELCWYGPRASDLSGLNGLIRATGVISCYSECSDAFPSITNEASGERHKCSIDNLAAYLISNGSLVDFVKSNNIKTILPYDSNPELEEFCLHNRIRLLSANDKLKDVLRDKTRIDEISESVGLASIPGRSGYIDNFNFETVARDFDLPLFLHFTEGAGGSGNYIVSTIEEFDNIKLHKSGERLNVKKYFTGKSCSIDVCVTPTSVLCGALEEMIIGSEPLNTNPTEYVGSSWFENGYSAELRRKIMEVGIALGNLLRAEGFIGFFHPDFLIGPDEAIYLTELNMRFGGSCGVYTNMQVIEGKLPLMIAHALSFLVPQIEFDSVGINEENLKPSEFGMMVLKNNFGKPIRLSSVYKPGLYRINGNSLDLLNPEATLNDLKDNHSIFLRGLPNTNKDFTIHDGAFVCEVVTRFPISDMNSKLNVEGKQIAHLLFSKLIV